MTLILGSEGSMGRRYQAILNYLNQPFEKYDPKLNHYGVRPSEKHARFIIATPTHTHLQWVERLDSYRKPILCEKPLSTDLDEVDAILSCSSPLSMTFQYGCLVDPRAHGSSHYNYYHSGNDGLVWDCFQIIALAKSKITLEKTSPIWSCTINGSALRRGDMDRAYVDCVRNWLNGACLSREALKAWHKKVKDYELRWKTQPMSL